MGSAESHPSGSVPEDDGSAAAIVNDGSAWKPSAPLGARHTADEPSNPAVVADSSRQATDPTGSNSGVPRHSHPSVSVVT